MYQIASGLFQGRHPRTVPPYDACLNVEERPAFYPTTGLKGYSHLPILDGPDPGPEWLKKAVEVIKNFRENGWSVYIHCAAGVSRSSFVTAAYLMMAFGLTPDEAITLIRSKNEDADPAPAFIMALRDYHKHLTDIG